MASEVRKVGDTAVANRSVADNESELPAGAAKLRPWILGPANEPQNLTFARLALASMPCSDCVTAPRSIARFGMEQDHVLHRVGCYEPEAPLSALCTHCQAVLEDLRITSKNSGRKHRRLNCQTRFA